MGHAVTLASFNIHAGMDGWGRTFDVVAACAELDADVLVLQEVWADDPRPGQPAAGSHAQQVAEALGYQLTELVMATGRRALPHDQADHRWKAGFDWRSQAHALYLDGARPFSADITATGRYQDARPGTFGLAVLSRLPVTGTSRLDLGRLRRDRARRGALVVHLEVDGEPLTVIGTHMSHLTYGSLGHFRRLRRLVDAEAGDGPAALLGDMNLWGPPVVRLFPGWVRAVRGRTWPAWRPHSQVDHILVRGPLLIQPGQVRPDAGSDHRPVRARLTLTGTTAPG